MKQMALLIGALAIFGLLVAQQPISVATNPVPVSQNGTWLMQPGNSANTTPWLVSPLFGNAVAPVECNTAALLQMTTATTTQLIAISGSTSIRVCAYALQNASSTATTVKLELGTGTACATGTLVFTPAWTLPASQPGVFMFNPSASFLNLGSGNALCVVNSAAATVNIQVWFVQY
jgi:hypothetical protein